MELQNFINQTTLRDMENYLSLKNPPGLVLKGIKGLGKEQAARYIASKLLKCAEDELSSTPDFMLLDSKGIKVEEINEMLEICDYNSIGNRRVVLIKNAHTMTKITQNKLLKLLEDRADSITVILHTEKDVLIDTIESRCYIIRFLPLLENQFKKLLENKKVEDQYHDFLYFLMAGAPFLLEEDMNLLEDYISHYEQLKTLTEKEDLLSLFHFLKEKDELEFFSSHEKYPAYNIRLLLYPFHCMCNHIISEEKGLSEFPHNLYGFKNCVDIMEYGLEHLNLCGQSYTKNDYFNLLRFIIQAGEE